MTLLDNIAKSLGYVKAPRGSGRTSMPMRVPEVSAAIAQNAAMQALTDPNGESNSQAYEVFSWVYFCVGQIAKSAALVDLDIFDTSQDDVVGMKDHPFVELLRKPNHMHSRFFLLETIFSYLQLTGNAVSDLKPLGKMKNMMSLYLSDNKIEDIAVVAELPKVWSLYLAGNPIKNFEPISRCRRVDTLDLSKCGVQDLAFLKPMTELKRLMLENNKIEDLAVLVEMAKGDKEQRFAPFWNIHLKGNSLSDAAKGQLEELKQLGARLHVE